MKIVIEILFVLTVGSERQTRVLQLQFYIFNPLERNNGMWTFFARNLFRLVAKLEKIQEKLRQRLFLALIALGCK